jgi:hypothetical protein
VITVVELAARLQMSDAPEKVASFAGCLTAHDPRTGRLPKRWAGQGMAATFTPAEADELAAEWYRAKDAVDAGRVLPVMERSAATGGYETDAEYAARQEETRDRYRA